MNILAKLISGFNSLHPPNLNNLNPLYNTNLNNLYPKNQKNLLNNTMPYYNGVRNCCQNTQLNNSNQYNNQFQNYYMPYVDQNYLSQIFYNLADSNGLITFDAALTGYRLFKPYSSYEEVFLMFSAIDFDKNGFIDLNEFLRAFSSY